MLEVFRIFPLWLTIITIFLIFIPATFSFFTRRILYRHLEDLEKKTRRLVDGNSQGIQPRFINLLQERFAKASQQIENVNTIALIDGIYHQETIKFFGFKIRCEEAEYITKTVPNLLLAFGLLGTFLGITLNLSSITQIINQGDSDIVNLTSQLQRPLQSMGIAFFTSLFGLSCASFLTVMNLKYNINLEKNSLLNNLEDYLDNIYKPSVEGDTRLDKAVNKMVDKQTEFLTRFHENVGQVLERTFKQAADRIADENEKSQQLAYQVYQNLLDASSAINTGGNIFQSSLETLEKQIETVQRMMPILRQNVESFEQSSNIMLTASSKIESSKFSENLETITADLIKVETQFSDSTQQLNDCVLTFRNDFDSCVSQMMKVFTNYEKFDLSIEKLQDSTKTMIQFSQEIKESKFSENLDKTTSNLIKMEEILLKSIKNLSQTIPSIEVNLKTLEVSTNKMTKLAQNISDVDSNISQINTRYLEMTNLSRDILLKLGENSVKNRDNYAQLFDHLNTINQGLEKRLKLLEDNEKLLLQAFKKIL